MVQQTMHHLAWVVLLQLLLLLPQAAIMLGRRGGAEHDFPALENADRGMPEGDSDGDYVSISDFDDVEPPFLNVDIEDEEAASCGEGANPATPVDDMPPMLGHSPTSSSSSSSSASADASDVEGPPPVPPPLVVPMDAMDDEEVALGRGWGEDTPGQLTWLARRQTKCIPRPLV